MLEVICTGRDSDILPLIEAIFLTRHLFGIDAKAFRPQVAVQGKTFACFIIVLNDVAPPIPHAWLANDDMTRGLNRTTLPVNSCFIRGQLLLIGDDLDIPCQNNPARLLIDFEFVSRALEFFDARLHVEEFLDLGRDLPKAIP